MLDDAENLILREQKKYTLFQLDSTTVSESAKREFRANLSKIKWAEQIVQSSYV